MVGHQNIGVKPAVVSRQRLAQLMQEPAAISVGKEDWLPIVATLDDVVRLAGEAETRWAGHREAPNSEKGSESFIDRIRDGA
jgi:hypothetical protein